MPAIKTPASTDSAVASAYRRVVYISQTTATEQEQEAIHRLSQAANAAGGITGLLIYGDGRFLQCLEGAPRNVQSILEGVRRDPQHQQLAVLLDEPVERRLFDTSAGGALAVDSASWRRLLEADWPTMDRLDRDSPPGLAVLIDLARHPIGSAEQAEHSEQARRARARFLLRRDRVDRRMGGPERLLWLAGALLMGALLVMVGRR